MNWSRQLNELGVTAAAVAAAAPAAEEEERGRHAPPSMSFGKFRPEQNRCHQGRSRVVRLTVEGREGSRRSSPESDQGRRVSRRSERHQGEVGRSRRYCRVEIIAVMTKNQYCLHGQAVLVFLFCIVLKNIAYYAKLWDNNDKKMKIFRKQGTDK